MLRVSGGLVVNPPTDKAHPGSRFSHFVSQASLQWWRIVATRNDKKPRVFRHLRNFPHTFREVAASTTKAIAGGLRTPPLAHPRASSMTPDTPTVDSGTEIGRASC